LTRGYHQRWPTRHEGEIESTVHLTWEGDRQSPIPRVVSWLFYKDTVLVPSDSIVTVVNRRYTQDLSNL
jgi:hypothetical protein